MARYIYQSYAKDGQGAVITSATVAVYLGGTTTAASVYAASAGGAAVNSVTSDSSTGYFSFWVDNSDYAQTQLFKILVSKNSFGTTTHDNIRVMPGINSLIEDPLPECAGNLNLGENSIIYDSSGSTVSSTELGYLDGQTANISTTLAGKVNNTGNETIAGIKTFSSFPIITTADSATTDYQAIHKKHFDDRALVLTGNQSVAGVKTFSSSPIVPTPTSGTAVVNKTYADSLSGLQSYVTFDGTPTSGGTVIVSSNVTDVDYVSVGKNTINWTNNFTTGGYCVTLGSADASSGKSVDIEIVTMSSGSLTIQCTEGDSNGTPIGCDLICVMAAGTLAST